MTEWKTYKIGDLCDTISDTYKGCADEVVLINTSDVLEGKCLNHTKEPNRNLKGQFKKTFKKYDILYSEIRPANKRFAYIDFDATDYIASTKLMVLRHNEKIEPLYLYYILQSQGVIDELQMLAESRSGTFPQITYSELSRLEVKLPNREIQKQILGILGAIDDKIENNRRINANLESQAQALYKQWFVDFDFPNEAGKPYKSSGGKMADSELGLIPEGWSVGDIYKYVNVVYGAPYKSVLFNERKDGNPLIRIRDLKTFSPQYYTQEILPNTEFINAGDVVAGMDAEFVPCLWMGEKGVLNQRCCKFVGKQDSISNYYVMFLVKPELEFVQSYKTGTTVSHLGKADIDKFVVVQPPFAVIEKFSKIADALLNNKIKLAKENITLATLRDTLLPKLMNGEIKL